MNIKFTAKASNKKRKSELLLHVPEEKRRKMDQTVKNQCGIILKALLTHPSARVFKTPVDPVALGIPDYFSIISHPMDLGTIKSKLDTNIYFTAAEFAADVNLMFSNAKFYNPPENSVHQMAVELDSFFKRRWKFHSALWNRQTKSVEVTQNGSGINAQDTQKVCSTKSMSDASFLAKKSNSLEEKEQLIKEIGANISALNLPALKDLKSALKGFLDANPANVKPTKVTEHGLHSSSAKVINKGPRGAVNSKPSVSSVSSRCGLCQRVICRCDHQISKAPAASEKSLKDGHKAANEKSQNSEVKHVPVKPTKVTEHGLHSSSAKVINKGPRGAVNSKPPVSSVSSRCGLCRCVICRCDHQISKLPAASEKSLEDGHKAAKKKSEGCVVKRVQAKPTKVTEHGSEKSLKDRHEAANEKSQDSEVKISLTHASASDQNSNGSGSVLDEGYTSTSSGFSAPTARSLIDDDCVKKALSAAKLKIRFADTIQAQLKEEELKLKTQREKERQAARIALEKLERSVELDDNLKFYRELEMLSQCSSADFSFAFGVRIGKHNAHVRSSLDLIGLHIKKEYNMDRNDDDEEAFLSDDIEEGEIIL